ncbi:hypothetical protein [Cognatilysobacter terrigena]|uniref:hypothetical protein n=1 Tax=Cognatilysobacter terrigena TaxID=2488749 RepID=UPI001061F56D|nr:hypothetical protein [Lysobacter terrigena]
MRSIASALTIALAMASPAASAQGVPSTEPMSADTDLTTPGSHARPVRCHPGDIEYYAGRTVGEVFDVAWPEVAPGVHADPARVVKTVAPTWPRGLGQDRAEVTVAILIGPDGRAVDAHAICASMAAIAKPAVRAAMRSVYMPARFNDVPAMSMAVWPFVFGLQDAPSTPVPDRPGGR